MPQNQVRPKSDFSKNIFKCLNLTILVSQNIFSSNKQQQLDSILSLIVHYLSYLNISKSVLVLPAGFSSFIFYFSSHHLS